MRFICEEYEPKRPPSNDLLREILTALVKRHGTFYRVAFALHIERNTLRLMRQKVGMK